MRVLPVIVSAFIALPVAAQEMPRFEVSQHCQTLGKLAGGLAPRLESACIRQEQKAYDKLKPRWGELAEEVRQNCTEFAGLASSGSYTLLEECVELQGELAGEKETFRY